MASKVIRQFVTRCASLTRSGSRPLKPNAIGRAVSSVIEQLEGRSYFAFTLVTSHPTQISASYGDASSPSTATPIDLNSYGDSLSFSAQSPQVTIKASDFATNSGAATKIDVAMMNVPTGDFYPSNNESLTYSSGIGKTYSGGNYPISDPLTYRLQTYPYTDFPALLSAGPSDGKITTTMTVTPNSDETYASLYLTNYGPGAFYTDLTGYTVLDDGKPIADPTRCNVSGHPIEYANGAAQTAFNDFLDDGENGVASALSRSWTNVSHSAGSQSASFGNGMSFGGLSYVVPISGWPLGNAYAVITSASSKKVVANGVSQIQTTPSSVCYFFESYNGTYFSAGGTDAKKIKYTVSGGNIQQEMPDGTVTEYAVPSGSTPGQMTSRTSPTGDSETVTWDATGTKPLSIDYTYTQHSGSTSTPVTESFAFSYNGTTNQVSRVVQSRNGTAVRTVDYDYYGTGDGNGNAGDLRSVTKRNGGIGSTVVETDYYRWYTTNTSTGYAGGLKFYLGDEAYQKVTHDNPSTAIGDISDATLQDYADNYFEYDTNGTDHRVTKEIALGSSQGCSCGKTGEGTYTFSYTPNPSTTMGADRNSWSMKTIETLPDGSQNIVYTNTAGDVILKVRNEVAAGKQYATWSQYDSDGNVIRSAEGNAVTGYSDTMFADLVGYGQSNSFLSATGEIDVTNYFTAADGTGAAIGYAKSTGYQQGASGTFVPTESWTYTDGGVAGDGVWDVASDTTYPNAADPTIQRVTSYSYDSFWQVGGVDTAQPKVVTTYLPQVSGAQNGADTATGAASSNYKTKTYLDSAGRVVWSVDGGGYVNYYQYDPLTGMKTEEIDDVNPATITTAGVAGPARDSTLPPALNLTTRYGTTDAQGNYVARSDSQGRWTVKIDPNNNYTYKVYDDTTADGTQRSVKTYTGWNAGTHQPTGPATATFDDPATGIHDTISYSYGGSGGLPVDAHGVPTGGEWDATHLGDVHVQSLARTLRNVSDQVVESRQYVDFSGLAYDPSAGGGWATLGTAGTNYLSTKYKYDGGGRRFQTTTPDGTITTTVYDARGLALSNWIGTDNTGGTNLVPIGAGGTNNMVMVASYQYDADGNQTSVTRYPHDASDANQITTMEYDFRDRLIGTRTGYSQHEVDDQPLITYIDYDNLDEPTAAYTYAGFAEDSSVYLNGPNDRPFPYALRSETTTQYDDQGRVYATHRFSVDPSNGTVSSSSIDTNDWYDPRGNLIKTQTSGSAAQKMAYDGAGRQIADYTTDGGGDSTYADAGNVTGDTVVQQTNTIYDADGNVILTTEKRRFHDATGTGALGRPTSGVRARLYYTPYWYDAADRLIGSAQIGTNFGSDYTRSNAVPARSDTKLVTTYAYDAAGRLYSTTDPRGLVNLTYYDLAGRTTKTIANYVDGTPSSADDQTTAYTYDGDGNVLTETAVLPSGTFQTTAFLYGASQSRGDGIDDNDVLIATQYPDPSTGAAGSGQQETYTTNALGDRTRFTDRNGTTHAYVYDTLNRLVADNVTTLGAGIDGAVTSIDYFYNSQGLLEEIVSFGNAGITSDVLRTFNGLGQITAEYQSHSGPASVTSTPAVRYAYSGLSSGSRLSSMTYPNGREIDYNYASGLDDAVGRLSGISDASGVLESYKYLGMDTVVERDHPQTGVSLSYVKAAGQANGDAGDQYTGLDRFDRVVNQKWVNAAGTVVDGFTYAYDRDGNVLAKANTLATALSDTYAYDDLNRLTADARGGSAHQSWSLDALGNMSSVTTDGTTTARTNNSQNQLTGLGTATLAYDGDGNTTTDEQGRTLVYDAWNRLVEAKSGSASLIRYAYDGLGRRIKNGTGDAYFDTAWQDIEDRTPLGQVSGQQVWSAAYVDAMVEQDRDTNSDGTPDQRLYPTQDANWNVTAVTDAGGTVQERFDYTAYGTRTVLNPTTYAAVADTLGYEQGFQGGTFEAALPNLILFRNRTYDTVTQRWLQEDPLGTKYQDGLGLYQFVRSSPTKLTDSSGLLPDPLNPGGALIVLIQQGFTASELQALGYSLAAIAAAQAAQAALTAHQTEISLWVERVFQNLRKTLSRDHGCPPDPCDVWDKVLKEATKQLVEEEQLLKYAEDQQWPRSTNSLNRITHDAIKQRVQDLNDALEEIRNKKIQDGC